VIWSHTDSIGWTALGSNSPTGIARMQLPTAEGGVGRRLPRGLGTIGFGYSSVWRLANIDVMRQAGAGFWRPEHVQGLGPELIVPIAAGKTVFALMRARYRWRVSDRPAQGDTWNVTFVVPTQTIKLP
jgi:hypothetical protein